MTNPDFGLSTEFDDYAIESIRTDVEASKLSESATDLDNSAFFANRVRGRVMYNHPAKAWMVYDGTRWRTDDDGEISRLAKGSCPRAWCMRAVAP